MELKPAWAEEYFQLISTALVRPERATELKTCVKQIGHVKKHYLPVAEATGMPWFAIAALHMLECSGNFTRHLHNGDPLTARTVRVPAGRPVAHEPPFSWEESAIDALLFHGAREVRDWNVIAMLWFWERYNGLGYKLGAGQATTPPRRSPYLWAGTYHYISGKYTSDGRFDPARASGQIGCVALLLGMQRAGLLPVDFSATLGKSSRWKA